MTSGNDRDGVRITQNERDVASCSAVGKLQVPRSAYGDVNRTTANREFTSQTKAQGGNTAFVRVSPLGAITEALAYRCP